MASKAVARELPYRLKVLVPGEQVTEKQAWLVDQLVSEGRDVPQIAEEWGLDAKNLYRELRKDHVQEYTERVVRKVFTSASTIAVGTMIRLSKSAKSELVRFQAAKDILDRAGHQPVVKTAIALKGDISVKIDLSG